MRVIKDEGEILLIQIFIDARVIFINIYINRKVGYIMVKYDRHFHEGTDGLNFGIGKGKEIKICRLDDIDMGGLSQEEFLEQKVYGKTSFKEYKGDNKNDADLSIIKIESSYFIVDTEVKEKDLDKAKGLIKTEDDRYVLVMKKSLLPIVLILLLAFAIMLGLITSTMFKGIDKPALNIEQLNIADSQGGDDLNLYTPETEFGSNTVVAYKDAYVDAEHRTIPLINPEENTNYAKFIVYDKDENTLYESELVKPNSQIEYDVYSIYSKPGDYTVGVRVIFYEPVVEGEEITGFIPCTVQVNNGNITLHVQE